MEKEMSMKEMMEMVKKLKEENEVLKKRKEGGRKEEIKGLIRERGRISIKEISEIVGISERNVSCILSYLKKDGFLLGTDSLGRKYEEVKE